MLCRACWAFLSDPSRAKMLDMCDLGCACLLKRCNPSHAGGPPVYRPPFGQLFLPCTKNSFGVHFSRHLHCRVQFFILCLPVIPMSHALCHFVESPRFVCHHANQTLYVLACSRAIFSIHTTNLALFYRHPSSGKEALPVFHCYSY